MQGSERTIDRTLARVAVLAAVLALSPMIAAWGERRVSAAEPLDFGRDVAPMLASCVRCHGPEKQESQLRVDRRASLLRGGDSGSPAIDPGNLETSELWARVTSDDESLRMPPEGPRLPQETLAKLRAWIEGGAAGADEPHGAEAATAGDADHWAFQPLTDQPLRDWESTPWTDTVVDRAIVRRLRESNLVPSQDADRVTLIRRLYLVMLGLPPTPEEVARFAADDRVDAWPRLVDEVLASPRYGERWGQHWLDIVRFGETHGFETNRERPTAWHYRDFVIESLNEDHPYDQFVREQLAGDALGVDVGTGFLVAGPYDLVKSPDVNLTRMQRQDELADMIQTTGGTFLGLTLGCARCHNHKFDPVTQRDYYAIQAVLAGVEHGERPLGPPPENRARLESIGAELRAARVELARAGAGRIERLWLDDVTTGERGAEPLVAPEGRGTNPDGDGPGHRDDPGDPSVGRPANLGGGSYTWWRHAPGGAEAERHDVLIYRPWLVGDYRVWLSWGCGHATHSADAEYWLDEDGDPATTGDQRRIAVVDQRRFADGAAADVPAALWSGLRDAGVWRLGPTTALLVRGGSQGTAVTADGVLFEAASAEGEAAPSSPAIASLGAPIAATRNVDNFDPRPARRVRLTILATNQAEPCLDELEIYSDDGRNVALASTGAKATCSSSLPGHAIHRLEHVHDGLYGNSHSWISNEPGGGWIELELPREERIVRVVWGRDREGKFGDRVATRYRIETALDDRDWTLASTSDNHLSAPRPLGEASPGAVSTPEERAALEAARGRLAALQAERGRLTTAPQAYLGRFRQPEPVRRLHRGDPTTPREEVGPGTVAALGDLGLAADAPEQARRLAFADWLVRDGRPLVSRVIANRVWQHHFGVGPVATASDFGANGAEPTHPELLDELAGELIRGGWSLKRLHRLLLLSHTWRQAGTPRPEALAVDADSRLLWRFPPRRLEAEAIRDSILSVGGVLGLAMGGEGFSAFDVQLENVRHYFPKQQFGPVDWRRMVYMTKVRQEQDGVFGLFDCPNGSQAMPRRSRSTTPLQALNLLNSRFVLQQAELLADRLRRDAGSDPAQQIERAWWLCCGRRPDDVERSAALELVAAHGLAPFCRALLNASEFLFIP